MNTFIVTYDLPRDGQKYQAVYAEIKRCNDWLHPLESVWIVITNENIQSLTNRLTAVMDSNDLLLVAPITKPIDGVLPLETQSWLKTRVPQRRRF